MKDKQDIYDRVTSKIVADLESGVLTWVQPWQIIKHAAGSITRPLRASGEKYRGINVLILWATALEKSYICPIWLTVQQGNKLGAYVKKGEKATYVFFFDKFKKTEVDKKTGEATLKEIFFGRSYAVFNGEQFNGLPGHFTATVEPVRLTPIERDSVCEAFFANTGADVRHGGNRAFYRRSDDFIQLPKPEQFQSTESYYGAKAHEFIHWTAHPKRLDRQFGEKFGDQKYAIEELVAEIGAAFLCADLAITPEPGADHAAYVGSWLKALKEDKRLIFSAAAQAQKAADFLHGLQPKIDPEREPADPAHARASSHGLPANALQ